MSTLIEEIAEELPKLEPWKQAEFERRVRQELAMLKEVRRGEEEDAGTKYPPLKTGAWAGVPRNDLGQPKGYFEATAGCFENEPFERPEQLPDAEREEW